MNFAGLDLSKFDLNSLGRSDLNLIYTAVRSNYEAGYGSIDIDFANELIINLRKYIKINIVDVRLSIFNTTGDAEYISPESRCMTMAIYMLPIDGLIDLEVLPYVEALNSFNNIDKINEIRSRPFSINNLHELWQELKAEQNKLNITGFWKRSCEFIYRKVNYQLLKNAYKKLHAIEKKGHAPADLALKILNYLEILDYIEKRMNDLDYRILMDFYPGDERNLRDLNFRVKHLLRLNLIILQDMPDYNPEPVNKKCSTLLFRAKQAIGNSLGVARLPKRASRITPD